MVYVMDNFFIRLTQAVHVLKIFFVTDYQANKLECLSLAILTLLSIMLILPKSIKLGYKGKAGTLAYLPRDSVMEKKVLEH
jgi:hypothetical protein